ncbi:hypothetical protein LTR36_001063 [Oleoguttula mirabilis]|uniref:UBC core domain-containing protein n=1 Tax=Oleoguttula mirabilis TaxID=1507867 RepID=A0AAV9JP91_9PEZI|nr:hypothetical protein LTR36_001063 [Oleoguttula mirabilis]
MSDDDATATFQAETRLPTKRLQHEWERLQRDGPIGSVYNLTPTDDSLSDWQLLIEPGEHSLYAGGTFKAKITVPLTYPMCQPAIRFETPIYHPNIACGATVYFEGGLSSSSWLPSMTLQTFVINVVALMDEPFAARYQYAATGEQLETDREGFEAEAKRWVEIYAVPASSRVEGDAVDVKVKVEVEVEVMEEEEGEQAKSIDACEEEK